MKRIIVFCITLLLLVGCGGQKEAAPQPEAPAPAAADPSAEPAQAPAESIADALAARWAAEGLLEGLYAMTADDVLDYYGIDFARCTGAAAFGDAVGFSHEAVVVEGDGAVLDEAEALLREHLEAVKAQYRDYDAEALALAEKAVLLREGDAVLYVVSPDAEAMLAAFRDLTK